MMDSLDLKDAATAEPPRLDKIGPLPASDVFFGAPASEAAFCGPAGLLQGPAFSAAELERIRELIKARLLDSAQQISPQAAAAIESTSLYNYHEVADRYDHSKLLSKLGRILPLASVNEIKQMSFFDYAREAFGPFHLSDEEGIGHEQVCFRIVRPERREDVGSLHRDTWFWDYYDFPVPAGMSRAKVWVPVCGASDLAGLLLAPGSHRRPAPYRSEVRNGKLAFVPDFDTQTIGLKRFCGSPGDPVMFNYDTLHVGSLNRAPTCRVSFEITILFNTAH
jgi:Phytanoyl-CoA dioxygenase (PhyH)